MKKLQDENKVSYDSTVSSSMEESILKAMAILEAEMEAKKPKRPDIKVWRGLLKIFITALVWTAMFFAFANYGIAWYYGLPLIAVTVVVFSKKTVIWSVLVYQRLAPDRLRESCLFTPTCSDYMILAIKKYGLIRGVFKGIGRLCRCHHPNGGVDNP